MIGLDQDEGQHMDNDQHQDHRITGSQDLRISGSQLPDDEDAKDGKPKSDAPPQ